MAWKNESRSEIGEKDESEYRRESVSRLGVVRVVREIDIREHTKALRGPGACASLVGMEVELPKGKGRKLVCVKCKRIGVIEYITGSEDF